MDLLELVGEFISLPGVQVLIVGVALIVMGSLSVAVFALRVTRSAWANAESANKHAAELAASLVKLNADTQHSNERHQAKLVESEERQTKALEAIEEIVVHIAHQEDLTRQTIARTGDAVGRNTEAIQQVRREQREGFVGITRDFGEGNTTLVREISGIQSRLDQLTDQIASAITTEELRDEIAGILEDFKGEFRDKLDSIVTTVSRVVELS